MAELEVKKEYRCDYFHVGREDDNPSGVPLHENTTPVLVKNKRNRLILKNGQINVTQAQSRREKLQFLQFANLVDSSWFCTISIFLATLVLSWLLFASMWWLICYTHGDFEEDHLPLVQQKNNYVPCVYEVSNFASCLLFSIETQHTVGYGKKAPTDECPEAIFVNAIQCIIGFIMQGFMAVIIFSKMTLPRLRSKTLLFSKNAMICPRNGSLYLMFRIGDMRRDHIIDANIRAFFVKSQSTLEGEVLKHRQDELILGADQCGKTSIFFNWPLIVVHKIDSESPLYNFSPADLLNSNLYFEIMVVLEGVMQSTGQMTQARTSYVSNEIIWGSRFLDMITFNRHRMEYEADFSLFDRFVYLPTPLSSARQLDDEKEKNVSGFY